MELIKHRPRTCTRIVPARSNLFFLLLLLSFTIQSAGNPSVNQLSKTLNSTWNTLLKETNCNLEPPQDSICIQPYHGKTITVRLFGEQVNALILFETTTTLDVTGPVIIQQSGFLIGPIDGYGYKVIHEQMSHGEHRNRQITDNGLKVFAHSVTGSSINPQGIELNKGGNWLDNNNEPWIYHWSALAKVRETLKELKNNLKNNHGIHYER